MTRLALLRSRGKHSLTKSRLRYLRSIGFRAPQPWLRPFMVRVYAVERSAIGGGR